MSEHSIPESTPVNQPERTPGKLQTVVYLPALSPGNLPEKKPSVACSIEMMENLPELPLENLAKSSTVVHYSPEMTLEKHQTVENSTGLCQEIRVKSAMVVY